MPTQPQGINPQDTAFASPDQFQAAGGAKDFSNVTTVQPGGTVSPSAEFYKYNNNPTVFKNSGFSASNPTPISSKTVTDAFDTTKDFTNSDYLKQSQDNIANAKAQMDAEQAALNNTTTAYQDFAKKNANSNVDFYNSQYNSSGLSDLYNQQSGLDKQIADLKSTMNGTLQDVRTSFNGNAPESLIQATADTRNRILQKQLDSLTAQRDALNARITPLANKVDKLLSAHESDVQKQLDVLSAQTGIARDNLQTGFELYKDAVTTFNGDRSAARQAVANLIANFPGAASALAASPQALAAIQAGRIDDPAVLDILGRTYKDIQAQDRMLQLQIAQQNADTNRMRALTYKAKKGNGIITPFSSAELRDVKNIIAANPGEWGNAAKAIDAAYGDGTATRYDSLLRSAYEIPADALRAVPPQGKSLTTAQYNQAREAFAQAHSYNTNAAYKAFDLAMKGELDKKGASLLTQLNNWFSQ